MKMWGNKVKKIVGTDPEGYQLTLELEDGRTGTVSLRNIFEKPKGLATDILKGGMFKRCFVESGAVAWPNGFELCPDMLRFTLEDQQKQNKKAA